MNKKGFTLIELIAVLIVLSVILIIAIPNIVNVKNTGMDAIRQGKIQTLVTLAEKKAEENIDNYQDCVGTISNENLSKCIFSVNDLISDEDSLSGNVFICFDSFNLIAKAYYDENASHNCA